MLLGRILGNMRQLGDVSVRQATACVNAGMHMRHMVTDGAEELGVVRRRASRE